LSGVSAFASAPEEETEAEGAMRWSELPGKRFGPYEVGAEIGHGGTSRVFQAFDHDQLREVAFKVIPSDADDRIAFIQRFIRETEIVRKLSHPNIVPIYDAGETEEFVFQAMMLVNGSTLRQIAAQRIGAQEAAQYMLQAARALHHAHLLGIVHRDVKPSNMLLPGDAPGRLLLTDFGTAKILGARGPTKTGATIGTPEYMSPEQAEGREVDQRSDIYSLGCTLYEALAGRPPFVGATPVSVLYQQVHAQPTYIRSYNSAVPRELWNVLRLCLAKRPEDRYPSAERLAEELLPFAEGLIQPTPTPWSAPATARLPNLPDRPTNRTLRAQTPGPVTPGSEARGATPPSSPILPPQPGYSIPPTGRTPGSQPGFPPQRQPRVTVRLNNDYGAPTPDSQGRYGSGGPPLSRGPARASGPLNSGPSYPPGGRGPSAPSYVPGGRGPDSLPGPRSIPGAYDYGYRSVPSGPLSARLNGPRSGVNSGPLSGAPGAPRQSMPSGPLRPQYPDSSAGGAYGPRSNAPSSQPITGYRSPASGEYRPGAAPLYRSPESSPYPAAPSRPANGYRGRAGTHPRNSKPVRRRAPWGMLAAGLIAALLLSGALALGAAGMGVFPGLAARPKATVAPTATLSPTETATATTAPPTATVGPSAQQLLNKQAAASFRSLFLSTGAGLYCSSSGSTHFSSGEIVYVHLCLSGEGAPGPVTVVARSGGQVVRTFYSDQYFSAGVTYYLGHTFAPGSYDMLVTVNINGKTGIAKDIKFTVS
jgi:serine/threonine-protein kinase